jgi:hypothetical protein
MNRAHAQPGRLRKLVTQTAGPGTTLIPQSSPNLWVTISSAPPSLEVDRHRIRKEYYLGVWYQRGLPAHPL